MRKSVLRAKVLALLAASVSVFGTYTPGFIDNAGTGATDTNSDRQYGGRVALFWAPMDHLTVKLNSLWQSTDSRDKDLHS
jgi:hypothetical protein